MYPGRSESPPEDSQPAQSGSIPRVNHAPVVRGLVDKRGVASGRECTFKWNPEANEAHLSLVSGMALVRGEVSGA